VLAGAEEEAGLSRHWAQLERLCELSRAAV